MNAPLTIEPKPPRMTADEFLAWAEEQPAGRFELVHGEVVPMTKERIEHAEVKFEAAVALRQAIQAAGLDCQALGDGMAVRVGGASVFVPDASVRCGPRLPRGTSEMTDPVVVVEVTSPSTSRVDHGFKLLGYFQLPSLHHYLILNAEERKAIHHRRVGEARFDTRILHAPEGEPGPDIVLDPPGLMLPLAHLFDAP